MYYNANETRNALNPINNKMTTTYTTGFTSEQLTKLGRAMERCGCKTVEEFIEKAAAEKIEAVLATPKQD